LWVPPISSGASYNDERSHQQENEGFFSILLGLVDTGAAYTYIPTGIADALGIDWRLCPDCTVHGVAGSGKGYAQDIKLVIIRAKHGWPIRGVFTQGMDAMGIALLGQNGFFDHCEASFRARAREFRISI